MTRPDRSSRLPAPPFQSRLARLRRPNCRSADRMKSRRRSKGRNASRRMQAGKYPCTGPARQGCSSRSSRNARRNTMAWFRVRLTEEEQRVVNEERSSHPNLRIREKMLVLWLLHNGLTRQKAAKIVGVSRATVQRYVAAFRDGGLDGLRQWNLSRPVSEMAAYRELIRASFEKQPATHHRRGVRTHLSTDRAAPRSQPGAQVPQGSGPEVAAGPCDPRAAQKNLAEHVADQAAFLETELKPRPGRRPSR